MPVYMRDWCDPIYSSKCGEGNGSPKSAARGRVERREAIELQTRKSLLKVLWGNRRKVDRLRLWTWRSRKGHVRQKGQGKENNKEKKKERQSLMESKARLGEGKSIPLCNINLERVHLTGDEAANK